MSFYLKDETLSRKSATVRVQQNFWEVVKPVKHLLEKNLSIRALVFLLKWIATGYTYN